MDGNSPELLQALKIVIKGEIKFLLQRLADTGEESVLVTASVEDGSTGHIASSKGDGFIEFASLDDIKTQFLTFCAGFREGSRSTWLGGGKQSFHRQRNISSSGNPIVLQSNLHNFVQQSGALGEKANNTEDFRKKNTAVIDLSDTKLTDNVDTGTKKHKNDSDGSCEQDNRQHSITKVRSNDNSTSSDIIRIKKRKKEMYLVSQNYASSIDKDSDSDGTKTASVHQKEIDPNKATQNPSEDNCPFIIEIDDIKEEYEDLEELESYSQRKFQNIVDNSCLPCARPAFVMQGGFSDSKRVGENAYFYHGNHSSLMESDSLEPQQSMNDSVHMSHNLDSLEALDDRRNAKRTHWIEESSMQCRSFPLDCMQTLTTNTGIYTYDTAFIKIGNMARCLICQKTLAHKFNRRFHWLSHVGDKCFVCNICGKAFNHPSNMRKHRKRHTTVLNSTKE
ncbi:hypothetical protein ACJMK2_025422 [Sinanodonta woodiana]|uniref:C2H2-type domain-containing protein n=1 Tax=Sinanodonta woodiana TaxID=1069815 RepID=A0ABD3XGF0_SINWO